MLRGLAHVSIWTDDVPAAVAWYSELLGIEPYFRRPEQGPAAYVEFRIGDYQDELGIVDRNYSPHREVTEPGGVILDWHVDDVDAAVERAVSLGAKVHDKPTDRGEGGWRTAAVVDPFGNILGFIHSPHYVQILKDLGKA